MISLDPAWLAANPLPDHGDGTDKNSRGRLLVAGGSLLVPGALRLTVEAALRAGAGKVRAATVAPAALALGAHIPEAGVVALPAGDQGEIAPDAAPLLLDQLARADAFVLGPGMSDRACAAALLERLLDRLPADLAILLDAAAVACAAPFADRLRRHAGRLVLTPHHGEMAALTGRDEDLIAADPETAARDAARDLGAILILKANQTVIATPDGTLLRYGGGGVGLATGGSGDVLAGIIGGLLARGAPPLTAAGWGVWLHGEAGKRLARDIAPIGFLARELLPQIPPLMVRATAPSCHPRESGDPPSDKRGGTEHP